MSDHYIDEGDLHKYRTELPNMTDDELDPYQYRVRSRTVKEPSTSDPVWYRVLVDGEDLHCECMDNFYRGDKPHDPIICVHILAAADREAMRRTWEA